MWKSPLCFQDSYKTFAIQTFAMQFLYFTLCGFKYWNTFVLFQFTFNFIAILETKYLRTGQLKFVENNLEKYVLKNMSVLSILAKCSIFIPLENVRKLLAWGVEIEHWIGLSSENWVLLILEYLDPFNKHVIGFFCHATVILSVNAFAYAIWCDILADCPFRLFYNYIL